MKFPLVISLYIGRKFFLGTMLVLAALVSIALLFDFIELMRRVGGRDIPISMVIQMALFKVPSIVPKLLPFSVLFGGILAFTRLTATSELVATRASGVSAWQFLLPAFGIAMIMGIFMITVFSPLSAIMLSKFEQIEGKYFKGSASMLSVSSTGLWLRQKDQDHDGKTIINALRYAHDDMELFDLTIFIFDNKDKFYERIDAKSAKLVDGHWQISNAILTMPGVAAKRYKELKLETNISRSQIQESFSQPETISFWELNSFIKNLRTAGFSPLRHILYWHTTLALPFMLCAMVFFAASFSLVSPRQGKVGIMISAGILSGFVIYFFSDVVVAIGLSGTIPAIMAAWVPTLVSILIGATIMLHLEDG